MILSCEIILGFRSVKNIHYYSWSPVIFTNHNTISTVVAVQCELYSMWFQNYTDRWRCFLPNEGSIPCIVLAERKLLV